MRIERRGGEEWNVILFCGVGLRYCDWSWCLRMGFMRGGGWGFRGEEGNGDGDRGLKRGERKGIELIEGENNTP